MCARRGFRRTGGNFCTHQLPYTLDQSPLDYHLFRFVKDQMQGQSYAMNEAVQKVTHTVCEQLKWCFTTRGSSRTVAKMHQSRWKILQRSKCNAQISLMWYFSIYNQLTPWSRVLPEKLTGLKLV